MTTNHTTFKKIFWNKFDLKNRVDLCPSSANVVYPITFKIKCMKFIRSLGHALHGVRYCYKTQPNFRIDLLVLTVVIIAGVILKINTSEWLFIIGCSTLVLALELINTAIEYLCDIITKDINPSIKIIKDISAAAVLLAAGLSAVAGTIIFLPKIIALLKS